MKKILIILLFLISLNLHAAGGHRGNINSLIHNGDTVLSTGDDGFLVTWNIQQKKSIDRFQLTTYKIQSMVKHPNKNEICILEIASLDTYKISAWDYGRKHKLFTISLDGPFTFLNYSANGSYILIAGDDGKILYILDSNTGKIVSIPFIPAGKISFALTGRSERNILIYQAEHEDDDGRYVFSGQILYFDLNTMNIAGTFQAPGDLYNLIIFGNNRFLAGINHDGLQLINAASGEVLDTRQNIGKNALLYAFNDGFYCLDFNQRTGEGNAILYRFTTDRNGRLLENRQALFFNGKINAIAFNRNMVFAQTDSSSQSFLLMLEQQNKITPFNFNFQTRIKEIAAAKDTIAFLDAHNTLFLIPNNPNVTERNSILTGIENQNYNRLTAISFNSKDYFVLWQDSNTRLAPQLLDSKGQRVNILPFMIGRHPLRSLSVYNNKLLALDSGGNISLYKQESLLEGDGSSRSVFNYTVIGAIDITFLNNDYIHICRSAVNSSPFIMINIKTEETIPLFYNAQAGIYTYTGNSGKNYSIVMLRNENRISTNFLELLNPSDAGYSSVNKVLFEYSGEARNISISESSRYLAVLCDSEGAKIISNENIDFERTSGLPIKMQSTNNHFITLDSEGNITWHENSTGKIERIFNLDQINTEN
ncbi:MAG: hypothetical protein FWB86_03440 [Treponema sp.]|nr:hypothetical protein [Treponema sp.]MCL2251211.1 hypothetical protein [Treponema sp.]